MVKVSAAMHPARSVGHKKEGEDPLQGDQARQLPNSRHDPGGIKHSTTHANIASLLQIAGYRVELGAIESAAMAAAGPLGAVGCVAILNGEDLVLYVAPDTVDIDVGAGGGSFVSASARSAAHDTPSVLYSRVVCGRSKCCLWHLTLWT